MAKQVSDAVPEFERYFKFVDYEGHDLGRLGQEIRKEEKAKARQEVMSEKMQGSVFGGMLLTAGSCIGAGMLALPILTGVAGFVPTMVMFFIAWLFMTSTAFLLIEVNNWFDKPVNLLSMVGKTLGKFGQLISWFLYLFLFYSLLVAYMADSGNHVANIFHGHLPKWSSTFFFVALFGWFVYLGTRPVDLANRWLMAGKITAYLCLIIFGIQYVKPSQLAYTDVKYTFFAVPVLIISFGFHNMIPSLFNYFEGDIPRIRKSIMYGSLLTLGIYLVWEVIAMGILPADVIAKSYASHIDAAQAIKDYLNKSVVGIFALLLALFAILTSFLAQSLSLVHFIADGLKVKHDRSWWLCLLALVPPLIVSMIFPKIFFYALDFAGGFCAVILFGIFPVLMVWIGRYRHKVSASYRIAGGQPLLVFIFLFALFIVFYQLSVMSGYKLFPVPGG